MEACEAATMVLVKLLERNIMISNEPATMAFVEFLLNL